MSAQANIVAFDGAATPASHTFVPARNSFPAGLEEDIAFWREAVSTLPTIAQGSVTTKLKRLKSGVYRVSLTVAIPVMESISGQNAAGYTAAPKVAYTNTMVATGYFHERSTIAERRLVRQMLTNVLGNVSTSVDASTTGVASELFDSLITAS